MVMMNTTWKLSAVVVWYLRGLPTPMRKMSGLIHSASCLLFVDLRAQLVLCSWIHRGAECMVHDRWSMY